MDNEIKSIHEFDFNLICEYYSTVERQGPGSPEVILKALSFIDNLTDKSLIADIGCGTGGQTMVLAQNTHGNITGVDLFPDFINRFYAPQVAAQEAFLKKYAGNKIVEDFIENERREETIYHKYKAYYGYVFYIGKRIG